VAGEWINKIKHLQHLELAVTSWNQRPENSTPPANIGSNPPNKEIVDLLRVFCSVATVSAAKVLRVEVLRQQLGFLNNRNVVSNLSFKGGFNYSHFITLL